MINIRHNTQLLYQPPFSTRPVDAPSPLADVGLAAGDSKAAPSGTMLILDLLLH